VLGDYKVVADRLIFTPRFPLKPGLSYRAVFDPAAISERGRDSFSTPEATVGTELPVEKETRPRGVEQPLSRRVETVLSIPALPPARPTAVDAIYPSSDELPENQLKFYVHFSAPMSRGDVYRHIRLLDVAGSPVDDAFLELPEELWDDTGRRLTLLLDPGRVKQDLKPHKEVGRALASGHAYTLIIAHEWRDARGAPLGSDFRKQFRVIEPDVRQPDPNRWRLTLPQAATRKPLVVDLGEPLDHAILQRAIRVSNPAGSVLEGDITIDQNETRWSFRPATPWLAGTHLLRIDANLEDLAGNSIARPFEVHLPSGRAAVIDQYTLRFQIELDPGEAAAPTPRP
jgi:hypothetical protein